MIPKANQRGGGRQLATHLLNEFDNDRVELADVRGAMARDLHGALEEWAMCAKATRCKKFLYSLSVNPDPQQRPVTREELYDYIARVEKALRLENQPRAVVFHVKYGREHCHVVWSRIDAANAKAVQISHDRQKLRTLTQDFARDHGLELPPGMRQDRLKDRFNRRQRLENLAEKQQEERTGISKAERIEAITAAWHESRDAEEFIQALEKRGYLLARGDQRAYVVVDLFGEIHSLTRHVRGVKASAIRARVAPYDLERLPHAAKAQEFARRKLERERVAVPERATEEERRRGALDKAQADRRAALQQKERAVIERHRVERETLQAAQQTADKGMLERRLARQPRGVLKFLARITGISFIAAQRQKREDRVRAAGHERQRQALQRRHDRELEEFSRRRRALESIEKRERRSLETSLRRDQFRAIARQPAVQVRRPPPQKLTAQQRENLEKVFARAAQPALAKQQQISGEGLTREFKEAVERMEEQREHDERRGAQRDKGAGGLRAPFNKAAGKDREGSDPGRGRNDQRRRRQPKFPAPVWNPDGL